MKTTHGGKYLVIALRTHGFVASAIDPHRYFPDEPGNQGWVVLTGSFTDRSRGACLPSAASLAQTHAIVARDPPSTSGASDVSVYEWAVST
jgi:hypothetical protein